METTKQNRVFIYVRVSTTRQKIEGQSIDAQILLLKNYCEYNNFEVIDVISDAGLSARTLNKREGLKEILIRADNKEFEHLVIFSLSRMCRNTSDALSIVKQLDKNGIKFHSLSEKINTDSAMGNFFITVLSAISQLESDLKSEHIKSIKKIAKETNQRFSKHLMGFNTENKLLTINESEMQVIKKIYKLKSENISLNKIAKILNDSNTKTSKDTKFYPSTISKILKNKLIYEKHL